MYSIPSILKNIASSLEKKIFLDLDGCLTDWDKGVKDLGPKAVRGLKEDATEEEKVYMWKSINDAGPSFWADLEWHPKGKELWKIVKKYNPTLLSSPGKIKWAKAGKELWVRDNIPGTPLIVESDKYIYAERNAVLIDDMKNNIDTWEEAGGIGILYKEDPKEVKEKLKSIM